jgi:hypothetical protein
MSRHWRGHCGDIHEQNMTLAHEFDKCSLRRVWQVARVAEASPSNLAQLGSLPILKTRGDCIGKRLFSEEEVLLPYPAPCPAISCYTLQQIVQRARKYPQY